MTIIYDVHVHILTPETCPLEYWAGKFRLTPELIQLVESIYRQFPKSALKMVEKILEDVTGDDANFNAVADRFFCETEDAIFKYYCDAGNLDIKPLFLNVYESGYQGDLGLLEAFAAVPGGLPEQADYYPAIKCYPKISGKPSDALLQWANDHGKPILAHTSRGGIWNRKLFASEADANAACHPVSWCSIIERFPKLKLVFCHGGGNADFVEYGLELEKLQKFGGLALTIRQFQEWVVKTNNWTQACFEVVDLYPDRVWIDTAYHQSVYTEPDKYQRALMAVLRIYGPNVCFGSDWPLVLFDVPSYRAYIEAFKAAAGPHWQQISYINPRRMLGLE